MIFHNVYDQFLSTYDKGLKCKINNTYTGCSIIKRILIIPILNAITINEAFTLYVNGIINPNNVLFL
jgi:hypothetical protein